MKAFAVVAAIAGLAAAAPHNQPESVVYSTEEVTIYSCHPTVTNCPYKSTAAPAVSTSVPSSVVAPVSSSVPLVTKTVYQTSLITKTECAASVTNCPARSQSVVVYTSIIPAYTTVCPATETPIWTPPAVPSSKTATGPAATSTPCSESTTVTVTVKPASSSVPAWGASGSGKPSGTGYAPYPSGPASSAVWGTASSSGVIKPSSAYPSQFTGAANPQATIGAIAGVGAIAALFL